VNASETEGASPVRTDSGMGELIGAQFVIFTTFAFLRHSLNAMAVRSGPPPAERQMTEPFARVTEPAHQI
jgi:hypothetical protein